MSPRAIDCQGFAGGFTRGVYEAGFEIVGKRELPGGFGVESVDANRDLVGAPDLDIQVGPQESWVPDDVDLVFGNPPCSGFSQVSDKKTTSDRRESINECMWALVRFAARCAPPVVAYESVQGAWRKGRDLLTDLRALLEEETGHEYTLYHVLHDAQLLGGAAQRRRYFWVASRIPIGFRLPDPVPWWTLRDVIGDLQGLENRLEAQPYAVDDADASGWARPKRTADGRVDGHLYAEAEDVQYSPGATALLEQDAWEQQRDFVPQYRKWLEAHDGEHPPGCEDPEWQERFTRIYNGSWQPKRWAWNRPAYVVTGGSFVRAVHPTEPRGLSLRELFRVQGFPDAWRIKPLVDELGTNNASLLPGKGIPVESGRWLATMIRAALEGEPYEDGNIVETEREREYVWKRNGNSKRGRPASISGLNGPVVSTEDREERRGTSRKEKTVTTTKTTMGDPKEAISDAFQLASVAAVDLTGLDDPADQKRAKELLYAVAYGMDAKISLRTYKKDAVAIGVMLDDEGELLVDRDEARGYVEEGRIVKVDPQLEPSLASPDDEAEEAPPPPTEKTPTRERIVHPFEGFGTAEPPYTDGVRHTADDGSHWEFNAAENAWKPLELPDPPDGPGEWRLDPDTMEWNDEAPPPEPPAPPPPPKAAKKTIACPNPDCKAQVVVDPEKGTGRRCWSCRCKIDEDGNLEALALEDTADERESVHELEDAEPTANDEVDELPEAFKQPKRSSREIEERRFDLTQLREQSHGYYVHRDYAAHFFRWGWASRHFISKGIHCLDIGCGQDLPLARCTIYANRLPSKLVCVDMNKIEDHVQPKWLTVYDETDITQQKVIDAILEEHGQFDIVTNFEVIEHMGPKDGDAMLAVIRQALKPDGYALISTPVFNGKAAANHIHEYEIDELREKFERAGFEVVQRWGTFASYYDIKRGVKAWFEDAGLEEEVADRVLDFYEDLREYYGDDVLANFMAPNIPDHSRNNVWQIAVAE